LTFHIRRGTRKHQEIEDRNLAIFISSFYGIQAKTCEQYFYQTHHIDRHHSQNLILYDFFVQ